MSNETGNSRGSAPSSTTNRTRKLRKQFADAKFRHGYLARSVRSFLAAQIRSLRGGISQGDFGKRIGKPQSVVSRLENQGTTVNIQTLIDIANKLDLGLSVRFVDFPTFVRQAEDHSMAAIAPAAYSTYAMQAAFPEPHVEVYPGRHLPQSPTTMKRVETKIETGVPPDVTVTAAPVMAA